MRFWYIFVSIGILMPTITWSETSIKAVTSNLHQKQENLSENNVSSYQFYHQALTLLSQEKDFDKAIEYLILASQGGVADASYLLGNIMRDNATHQKDYNTSLTYYRLAEDAGFIL